MAIFKFSNAGGFGTYQRYNDFLAGNPAVIPDRGSMYPLGTFILSSAQASVEFTNIPQTYTHLQIRGFGISGTTPRIYIQYNSDTSSNYTYHFVQGSGNSSSASSTSGSNQTENWLFVNGFIGANNPAPFIVDVLDYKNANKFKTIRSLEGNDNNSAGYIALASGLWRSTNAITSIKIYVSTGTFSANSTFSLYGVNA